MPKIITEQEIEEAALEILKELDYTIIGGIDIAPDGISPEREKWSDVVLVQRLKDAIDRIDANKHIPREAKEEAVKKVLRIASPQLIQDNKSFHNMLVNGVDVEYKKGDRIINDYVWIFDFDKPNNNEFVAVNQFTIIEDRSNRRPDIILFVNGLPLAVIELKNPAEEKATWQSAYNQFQTYMKDIPSLFRFNEILVASDGMEARAGTITAEKEWFQLWRTIDGSKIKSEIKSKTMDVLLRGMFDKKIFTDLIRHFIVFETGKKKITKKLAGYHQYYAVNKAIEATIKASKGDKRIGVVWHTQGAGKSLSMVFYAGKLVLTLDNPTIVVLTDRNDLDDQLFGTFSKCHGLLRQDPVQAESREKMQEYLKVASGGVVFTTIQKFHPEEKGKSHLILSDRSNIIVIADEAHRSQYGFSAKIQKEDPSLTRYGYAKYLRDALPNASFIGFTGTPIEKADKSTIAVFGNYIDKYDIERAVDDGATVRIFYESRLAKLELKDKEKPKIDPEFEELTEGEEVEKKEKLKSKWARLEAVVGANKRIKQIAKDIVNHWEERLKVIDGKAMIVCMSRRICVELHNEIVKLRPGWYNKEDNKGIIKIIMTGSAADKLDWQEHIRTKQKRRDLGDRMKDDADKLKITIVRDMWLTGFDVPSLHTMYLDKPMHSHGLMQAIARVNRVFKDKKGGLVVDYLGIADELKKALSEYTESGGEGKPVFEQQEAIALMLEKYEILTGLLHGFNYKKFFTAKSTEKTFIIAGSMEHILKQKDGKERFVKYVNELLHAFALSIPNEDAIKIREDVGFFQLLKAQFGKTSTGTGKTTEDLDTAIKQIVSKAISSTEVIDIFASIGLKKPDISILSEEFLEEVKGMPQKNLAFELLKKLLNDEIKTKSRKNILQARSFSEMLEQAIKNYQNKSVETAKVIDELIQLAKDMRDANKRGEKLNMTDDELAFYDALAENGSAKSMLGDDKLRDIARELLSMVKNTITIDWTIKESVQAKLRVYVKRILKKYDYPPDKQQKATELVLEQATILCKDWAENPISTESNQL